MKKDSKWVVPRIATLIDPRIAISRHIGWTRPLSNITDYSLPEPDNYNFAVLNPRPCECPLIKDQVFYLDKKSKNWWTVYYVPEDQREEFLTWARPLTFEVCWTPQRCSSIRHPRTLLWTRGTTAEQTTNERLYTMGYYDLLQSSLNIDISNILGQPRDNMPQGEFT